MYAWSDHEVIACLLYSNQIHIPLTVGANVQCWSTLSPVWLKVQ